MVFLIVDIIRLTHLVNIDKFVFGNKYFFSALTILITIVMGFGYIKYQKKDRKELTINVAKTKQDKQLRIVAISDLHLGYGIGNKELNSWIKLINDEKPDIVLIAGDLIDTNIKPVLQRNMADNLKRINAKHGVYAVLGNHEYISGGNECIDFINSANITLLQDSGILVNDLYVLGRDDVSNKSRKELAQLIESFDKTKAIILLDHQPINLNDAAENNVDLQISGHTHRGQVWPISWITDKIFEVSHGYCQKNDTHYYITSGLGIWGGKFRIGSRSEYVVINLNY